MHRRRHPQSLPCPSTLLPFCPGAYLPLPLILRSFVCLSLLLLLLLQMIRDIKAAVTIPVMAKARIGHFVEAQILEALGIDYIDESEVGACWVLVALDCLGCLCGLLGSVQLSGVVW